MPISKDDFKGRQFIGIFLITSFFGDKVMFGCESMHIFYILGRVLLTTKPSYRTVLLFGKNKTPSDKKKDIPQDVFSKIHVLQN